MSELILQPFCHFTYIIAHFPTLLLLQPTSQLILQPFHCFNYVTVHSPTLLSLPLHLQPFCHFTYVRAHSPTFLSLHLRHSSFSNPYAASTYITAHSPTLPLLHLCHSSFSNPSFASPTSEALYLIHLAHDVRATTRDNIGQYTEKVYTHSFRIEIKIPNPAGNLI